MIHQLELAIMPLVDDANFNDLRFLACNLRDEDKLELSVTRDISKFEDLAWAGAYSRWRKVVIHDRRPVFGFGAAEVHGMKRVHVWGFGCKEAVHGLKPATRYIKKFMIPEILASGFTEAQAVSHPANLISHRWLEFLGFKFKGALAGVGARKEEMLLFSLSADDLARRAPVPLAA
jgi:hypothetical protein